MSVVLHQAFALNAAGKVVSIDEVDRGLACGCSCQGCGDSLIAKQGDIRNWYFSHTSKADCAGAAETALHKAAKLVLLESNALMVPAITLHRSIRLESGHVGKGQATRGAGLLSYQAPEAEKAHGSIQPDVTLATEYGVVFIEIVVTNAVNREKHGKLINIGIPTLEIALRLARRAFPKGEAWPELKAAVLDSLDNKKWLIDLEKLRLSDEALAAASLDAERASIEPLPAPQDRNVFHFGRSTASLRMAPFGILVNARSTDFAVDPLLTGWLQKWGGRFNSKRQNWVFPADNLERLRAALRTLETRMEKESPYDQHQRVLAEYNR